MGKRERSARIVNEVSAPGAFEGVRLRRTRGAPEGRAGDQSEHGRARDAARWLARLAPERLPPGCELTVNDEQSKWYRLRLGVLPVRAILEIEIWQGELWAHLAVTGRAAPPSLPEVSYCRDLFLGDRKAIQILPRKLERSEAGARTVHLYAPLDSDALPSFARASTPAFSDQ